MHEQQTSQTGIREPAMTSGAALVDGHVHLHACYNIGTALDIAFRNLDRMRSQLNLPADTPRILWLVEHRDEGATERLRASTGRNEWWQVVAEDGPILKLQHADDGHELTLVFGRQIRTSEDLEVLVVGTTETTPSDRPLEETIESWLDQDVLVMVPWGFGKWTGRRRQAVERAYETFSARGLRLADTGAHSGLRRDPRVFGRSLGDGNPIFSGSDPFPFPDQVRAIGRTGFTLNHVPSDFDWSDLLHAIVSLKEQPSRFGRPLSVWDFGRLQGKMQVRKRFGTGGAA